jgi:hypothetical protein
MTDHRPHLTELPEDHDITQHHNCAIRKLHVEHSSLPFRLVWGQALLLSFTAALPRGVRDSFIDDGRADPSLVQPSQKSRNFANKLEGGGDR